MKKNHRKRGISIIEFLIAFVIGVVLLAAVVIVWQSVEKAWLSEQINSRLIGELEMFMERFKKEIAASDGNKMFFYPGDALTYEAISFPAAVDNDGDGFIEVDAGGNVVWDQTVIYHVYQTLGGETQLRRTLFDPRIDLSKENRQIQINEVVTNGEAIETTPNTGNASTRFLFTCSATSSAEPVVLIIQPSAREFDGYNESTARSAEISFGSVTLTAGEHYVTFAVEGTSQTGYKLGIDSFRLSPCGCSREAEEAVVHNDSGKSKTNEDMVSYGSWSGNRHLEYQAADETDYLSLKFYYDEWIETNFHRCSPSKTLIDYNDTDGDGGTTAIKDYIVRLSGYGETWNVLEQAGETTPEQAVNITGPGTGRNYRNVISYQITDTGGSAVRFKFKNCSATYDLPIESATLFERSDGQDGEESTKKIITFSGNNSVTIPRGSYLWSDWINMLNINNFNKDEDYLISFFVSGSNSLGMSSWQGPGGAPHSYYIGSDTDYSEVADWPDSALESDTIYALESIEVSYYSSGTLISPIYDTQLDNPVYSTLSWTMAKNNYGDYASGGLGANVIIRVRSNDSKDALLIDNDWSDELAIDTQSAATGSAGISSIAGGRYVQFQVDFDSQPTLSMYDYTKSCVLKKVNIKWPGESTPGGTTVVSLNGFITSRPEYGRFSVEVDGNSLTKGLGLTLELTKDVFGVGPVTRSISTEIEPRNTDR
ncbi:MAG: hypothetical protein U9Q24_01785 [Candidatus Ratteibacteria bacterium]|nr:hypothetical protein [Candidatus Ratteibacteria bacterium]